MGNELTDSFEPVKATRTYLQMAHPTDFRPGFGEFPEFTIRRVDNPTPDLYRELYRTVGEAYQWRDRWDWTDEQIAAHLASPTITLWVAQNAGRFAGFYELRRVPEDDAVEIAYFGLAPESLGKGLGKHLLSYAVLDAWGMKPKRVWLHTCTLDHPAALPNYIARGFAPYRTETYRVDSKPMFNLRLPKISRRALWLTLAGIILIPLIVLALWTWSALTWSYSEGERAGYVQKFSKKGWLCKTWEGELAMINVPGAMQEKFQFTVRDDVIAEHVTASMGKRTPSRSAASVSLACLIRSKSCSRICCGWKTDASSRRRTSKRWRAGIPRPPRKRKSPSCRRGC
jgi:GNAT superfamily N-acetyltransferase